MREHQGKIFNFTQEDVKKFFPEGPSGRIIHDLRGFTEGQLGLLVREPTLKTISFLEQSLAGGFQTPYLFLGNHDEIRNADIDKIRWKRRIWKKCNNESSCSLGKIQWLARLIPQ